MNRRLLTRGLAALAFSLLSAIPAVARDIPLGDVRITEPGARTGRSTVTPWSGTWWPMAAGELSLGWNGTGADYVYDTASKTYRRATGQKADNDLAPLLKFDAWRKALTGTDPGAALVELHGSGRFRHHVYGDEKERYDREGVSYSWWGHCNGWCAAAILEAEPLGPVSGGGIRFDVADLKGLLTESHYGVESDFTGRRYNAPEAFERDSREPGRLLLAALNANAPKPVAEYVAWYEKAYETTMSATARAAARPADFKDELESFERSYADRFDRAYADLDPHVFHQILESVIGQRHLAFVADITCNEEVWNHPAYGYDSTVERVRTFTENGASKTEWRVRTVVQYATDGVSESVLGIESFTRTYTYSLITDSTGKPIGGAWTGASVDDHPDFAWLPTLNPTGFDASDNPNLRWGDLVTLYPQVHAAAAARSIDLTVNGVQATSRRASGRTTTFPQPVAVPAGDVVLGVRSASAGVNRVAYFEQRLDASGAVPVVAREPLVTLGTSSTAPTFEATARLTSGKRMVLCYAYDAAGKLLSIDELTLQVGANAPPPQADDAFEENDATGAAAAITAGVHQNLQCNDEDWFKLTLAQGASLTATIDFTHSAGDLDLEVVGPAGQVGASDGTSNQEKVEKTGLAAGVYKVRVHGYSGARGRYTLTIVTGGNAPPPASTDDRFEENDTRAAAAAIAAGAYPGLSCKDDDFFKVTLTAESTLTVKTEFRHAEGDLDLQLLDASGTELAKSDSTADAEEVKKERLAPGTYLFRVHGYNGAKAAYGVTVTVTPTGATPPATRSGTITATSLNVRRGPGTTYQVATTLSQNAAVTILGESGTWYRVTWTGAPTGDLWVSKQYVRLN
jgi:hypothetical protein